MAVDALNHDNYDISVVDPGFVGRGLSGRGRGCLEDCSGSRAKVVGSPLGKVFFKKDFDICQASKISKLSKKARKISDISDLTCGSSKVWEVFKTLF